MNIILFAQLLTFVLVSFFGAIVFLHNAKTPANQYFGVFTFGVATWNLSLFLAISEFGQSLLWGRLAFAFGALIPAGLFLFASSFPTLEPRFTLKRVVLSVSALGFAALSLSSIMIKSAYSVEHIYLFGALGSSYFAFVAYFFGVLIMSLIKLERKRRRAVGIRHTQLAYVVISMFLFLIPLFVTQLILPSFGIFKYNNIGPLFSLPMVALMTYAIAKHGLLDIRLVIQRSLIYTVLLGTVIGAYLSIISLIGYFFQRAGNFAVLISAGVTMCLGIFGVPLLERRFREWTDPLFFKGKYDYRAATRELSEIMNRIIDPDVLFTESTSALKRILKVTHVRIVIQKNEKEHGDPVTETDMRHLHAWHNSERIITANSCYPYCPVFDHATRTIVQQDKNIGSTELVVLILLENRLLGLALLGEKLSGDSYTEEDYMLLESFSAQFAVALEKAALYGQVKEHSKELTRKVAERTRELAELRESERQMIIEIAHGLQTPLTVLKTEIGRLKNKAGNNDVHLSTFEASVDMVSKFIYDLLTLARLESTPEQVIREKIDLSELLKEIVEYVGITAESEHITVADTIADSVFIRGDKTKLTEAMINLLSNAVKYMGNSTKRQIDVSLHTEKDNAIIIVSDTGIGIAPNDLPRIFSRFYRAKQSAALQKGGTGLGLAITKMIVERHGGTIAVANNEQGGAQFTIHLPLGE